MSGGQIEEFADQVAALSGGTVRIEPRYRAAGEVDASGTRRSAGSSSTASSTSAGTGARLGHRGRHDPARAHHPAAGDDRRPPRRRRLRRRARARPDGGPRRRRGHRPGAAAGGDPPPDDPRDRDDVVSGWPPAAPYAPRGRRPPGPSSRPSAPSRPTRTSAPRWSPPSRAWASRDNDRRGRQHGRQPAAVPQGQHAGRPRAGVRRAERRAAAVAARGGAGHPRLGGRDPDRRRRRGRGVLRGRRDGRPRPGGRLTRGHHGRRRGDRRAARRPRDGRADRPDRRARLRRARAPLARSSGRPTVSPATLVPDPGRLPDGVYRVEFTDDYLAERGCRRTWSPSTTASGRSPSRTGRGRRPGRARPHRDLRRDLRGPRRRPLLALRRGADRVRGPVVARTRRQPALGPVADGPADGHFHWGRPWQRVGDAEGVAAAPTPRPSSRTAATSPTAPTASGSPTPTWPTTA